MISIQPGTRVKVTSGLHIGRPGTALNAPEEGEGQVDVRLHPLKSATEQLRAVTRSFLVSQLTVLPPQPVTP